MSETISEEKEEQLQWRRAHPLSPLTQIWVILVLVVWNIVTSLGNNWEETSGTFLEKVGRILSDRFMDSPLILGGIGVIAVLALALFYWAWFFTFFAVDSEAFYQRSGLLSKKFRKAKLERIQSVDIVRPLLPRLLGLAEVSVDVADGSESALKIQFLKHADANAFRSALLRKTQEQKEETGVSPSLPATEPEESAATPDSETELTFLPPARLIGSIFLSPKIWGYFIFSLITMGTLIWATGSIWGAIAGNLAIVVMTVSAIWNEFNRGYRFRISHGPEGLKIRKGFTNATTQSVPTGRIQALEIKQPFLWKKLGWYTVTMNVAGYGIEIQDDKVHRSNLMLVATEEDLNRVLPMVIAERWDAGQDLKLFQQVMYGSGTEQNFTPSPSSSKWFDPLTYRKNGYSITPNFLLIRRGLIVRRLTLVPHNCIQSIELSDGPVQRKLNLATLKLGSVAGEITPVAKNIAREDAKRLLASY